MRIFNFRRSRPDLVMTMEIVSLAAGQSLQALGNDIAVRSGAQKGDVEWKELSGTPKRIVSNTFKVANRNLPVRIGLVQLSDTEVAMINFGLTTPDDYDRVLYEDKCDGVLESVQVLKK
jgi:hypothetical protein